MAFLLFTFANNIVLYLRICLPDDRILFLGEPVGRRTAIVSARDYLYEFAYWKIWSELSPTDQKVVRAIA